MMASFACCLNESCCLPSTPVKKNSVELVNRAKPLPSGHIMNGLCESFYNKLWQVLMMMERERENSAYEKVSRQTAERNDDIRNNICVLCSGTNVGTGQEWCAVCVARLMSGLCWCCWPFVIRTTTNTTGQRCDFVWMDIAHAVRLLRASWQSTVRDDAILDGGQV